jgi:hypothetical protein
MENICKMCLSSPANQTGSHLLSAFMVESMIGPRDHEIGYQITASADLDYRKNVGARPIKQDYILCRGCEQRLSFLESYISAEFTRKIDNENYSSNFEIVNHPTSLPFKKCLRVNPRAFALLIYSVFWRASISETVFKDFRMSTHVEEQLRSQLDRFLPPYENFRVKAKPKEWIKELNESPEFRCYQFMIFKCQNILTHGKSRNIIMTHPKFTQPYQFLANEFLIYFFQHGDTQLTEDFFKLAATFGDLTHLINNCSELKIGILTETQWNGILNIPKAALEQQKKNAIKKSLFSKFSMENGRIPTEEELKSLYSDYINSQPQPDWENEGTEENDEIGS